MSVIADKQLIADYVRREDVVLATFEARASLKAGREPQWNLIFPRGTWHGPNFEKLGGSFTVDDAFISEVLENWEAAGKPRLPVRWTHEHLRNTDPAKAPLLDRKAANVIELRATEAGLEGLTEWKPAGAKDIEDGVFDAWSAEWSPKHINRLTGKVGGWFLSGVALTSEPYFNLMPPVAASAVDAETTEPTPQHRSNTMNEEQLKALRAKLGLAADATPEQCIAAAHIAPTVTASATDAATLTAAVKAAVEPLEAKLKASDEEAAKLKTALLERDVEALVATAKRGDGKTGRAINDTLTATAKKLAATEGLKAAEDFLNALPASVPLAPVGTPGTVEAPLTADAAGKKLLARAEELRAAKDPNPMVTAMREMPDVALIAEGRTTTTK